MSRARTLAGAIGSDGALNVADVAGLAAVASSGSASDLSTGTLPIARIADGAVTPAKLANSGYEFGMRNRIINGAMVIDQRNAGASVTTSVLQTQIYTVDRWAYYNDVVSKRTIQQVTTAPPGFKNSLKVTVIATDTAGPQQFIRHSIEGVNIVDFAWGTASAQPATLSFWVRSSVTGQHGGSLQNANSSRSYPFAYTINVADTWEYKTIAITGDTSGGWNTDNTLGIAVQFEHGVGWQKATAGAWIGQNATSSTGSVNLCATNGATWYITGVQLEKGSTATSFDFRSYGTELALCQRYYQHSVPTWGTSRSTDNYIHSSAYFKVTMRTNPTLTQAYNTYGQTISIQDQNANYYVTAAQGVASSSLGAGYNASAEL